MPRFASPPESVSHVQPGASHYCTVAFTDPHLFCSLSCETMSERARREKQAKLSKLAELKRAREGGGRSYKVRLGRAWLTRGADRERTRFQVEEDDRLYDEVTEDQYKSVVRGRLAQDDFVVDDGVGGYMDTGVDDFEEPEADEESEEERSKSKGTRFIGIFTVCV